MAIVNQYRYRCTTEGVDVYEWRDQGSTPTQCVNNPAHIIDSTSITIVNTTGMDADVTTDGQLKVASEPVPGTEIYFFSPNVTDKTTWYEGSIQVTQEALTDSGNQTTWNSANVNWIDLVHGKVMSETDLVTAEASYLETIEVSTDGGTTWTTKTRNTWGQTDNDYDIDYTNGTVTFNAALGVTDQVRATYRYGTTFQFTVKPATGKRLKVGYVEVQFSRDIQITGAAIFQIKVYNPADLPNKMVYVERRYKTLKDYYTEATGPFPPLPPQGKIVVEEITGITNIEAKCQAGYQIVGSRHDGTNWIALMSGIDPTDDRATKNDVLTIPFKYGTYRNIKDSDGAEIVVTLENGAFGGEWGTFTFYCISENE